MNQLMINAIRSWFFVFVLNTMQEATAMNPDMTVEKIEIQQQAVQP